MCAPGTTTDISTAAQILRIGGTRAFHLLKHGNFPLPVLSEGRRVLVPSALPLESPREEDFSGIRKALSLAEIRPGHRSVSTSPIAGHSTWSARRTQQWSAMVTVRTSVLTRECPPR
jgi:hypothetical protein